MHTLCHGRTGAVVTTDTQPPMCEANNVHTIVTKGSEKLHLEHQSMLLLEFAHKGIEHVIRNQFLCHALNKMHVIVCYTLVEAVHERRR